MKIKYSALVMGVSGKLNGSVGATNRGGAYLRNKGVVSNPNTSAQSAVRSRFGSLSSQFRSLTPEQITAWNTASASFPIIDRLGDTRYLSGLGLYVQLNSNLSNIGAPLLTSPPEKQSFPNWILDSGSFVVDAGVLIVGSAVVNKGLPDLSNFQIVIKATPPLSAGVTYAKNQMRQLVSVAGTATLATQTVDYLTEYNSRYGVPGLNQNVFVQAFLISKISGEASAVQQVKGIVTEP